MSRIVLALLFATVSLSSFADEEPGVWAGGSFLFKQGPKLVSRAGELFVPAMGKGKVKLKLGDKIAESTEFKTEKVFGRTVFNVAFVNAPETPNQVVVLTGTYLRGSNLAFYAGDVYSKPMGSILDEHGLLEDHRTHRADWTYVASFMFKKDIETEK